MSAALSTVETPHDYDAEQARGRGGLMPHSTVFKHPDGWMPGDTMCDCDIGQRTRGLQHAGPWSWEGQCPMWVETL